MKAVNRTLLFLSWAAAALVLLWPDPDNVLFLPQEEPALAAPVSESKQPERPANNPLLEEYRRRARQTGINLEFTSVVRALVPYDGRLNKDSLELEIFCLPEKSLDVLLIGDSTMAWGVIPSAVEQRSGLRTGMFAMRSLYLNERMMRVTERLQKMYLKPGGITLFGFAIWTQLQEPDIVRRGELYTFSELSDDEFRNFAAKRRRECGTNLQGPALEEPAALPFSKSALLAHTETLDSFREEMRSRTVRLRPSRLAEEIRREIHPAWFTEKTGSASESEKQEPGGPAAPDEVRERALYGDYREKISPGSFQFIRWDHQTLTATGPFALRSIRSTLPPDPSFTPNANHKRNAGALLRLPGRKGFIITFYPEHGSYRVQRAIYRTLYPELDLVDLGVLHPENTSFSMDNEGHPANSGGLEKSLMIADWLRENYRPARK